MNYNYSFPEINENDPALSISGYNAAMRLLTVLKNIRGGGNIVVTKSLTGITISDAKKSAASNLENPCVKITAINGGDTDGFTSVDGNFFLNGILDTNNDPSKFYVWSYPNERKEDLSTVFPQIAVGKLYPIKQYYWPENGELRWFLDGIFGQTCTV